MDQVAPISGAIGSLAVTHYGVQAGLDRATQSTIVVASLPPAPDPPIKPVSLLWYNQFATLPAAWISIAALFVFLCGLSYGGYRLVRAHQALFRAIILSTSQTPKLPILPPPSAPTAPPVQPSPVPAPVVQPLPTPQPIAKPAPTPVPPPSLPAVAGKNTSYSMGALVIKYFPLTSDGQNIDQSVTGDVGGSYASVRQHTIDITNNLLTYLPKATTYLGYTYGGNSPALTYHVAASFEHTTAVPINSTLHAGHPTLPDYAGILSSHNICGYVDGQGVREVWLFAYQGPSKPGQSYPYLDIAESKMSGPYGDISDSWRWDDMPHCQHTYRVYTFNDGRGVTEAAHSWSHQIEAELTAVDSNLFGLFQGPAHPPLSQTTGRCGSVHNPPNARAEYDWVNSSPWQSDCRDWQPDSLGVVTNISCSTWGCSDISDTNNAQLNWIVWMWQNLPGRNNTKTYQGAPLRNWWDIHGNFDSVMSSSKRLTL